MQSILQAVKPLYSMLVISALLFTCAAPAFAQTDAKAAQPLPAIALQSEVIPSGEQQDPQNAKNNLQQTQAMLAEQEEQQWLNSMETERSSVPSFAELPLPREDGIPITQIAAGQYYTMLVKSNGDLWGMGFNAYGQLATGDNYARARGVPRKSIVTDVKKVACGEKHTLILKNDGTVWTCGYNEHGEAGVGDETSDRILTPTQLTSLTEDGIPVVDIVAGMRHSMALKADGSLWAWGWNICWELGWAPNQLISYSPAAVTLPDMASGIKKIGAGVHYSALLLENGDLYFSGRQTYAEGYFEDYHSFVKIKQNINDIYCGQNDFLTVASNEEGGSTVEAICHRSSFSFASPVTAGCVYSDHALLRSDGRWYAAGDNSSGQCGVTGSETLSEFTLVDGTDDWLAGRLTAAAAGKAHSVALKADGNVVVWGSNQYGQLGVPEDFSALPAPAGSPYLSIYSGSTIEDAQPLFDLKTPDAETDTLGYTIADIDTPLYLRLENGSADTFLLEAAPETNGLSLKLSLLNADGPLIRSFTESTEVVLLDNTTYYLCVRSADRHRCGGFMIRYNRLGLRGISFDTALPLQTGEQQLSAYQGKNLYASFTAEHTGSYFITTEDEQALSCTLFDGERRQLQTFVCSGQIALSTGQTVYLMITNPRPNAFSTLRVFLSTPDTRTKQVAAGQNFSLIVREDGTVLGCGHNAFGQLGIGKKQTRQAECKAAAIIGVQKVDCGERHAVALKEDGSIWTWGANDKYQLGMDGTESQPLPQQITALGTDNIDVIAQLHGGIALKQDGSLVGWGRNYYGELGTGSAQPIIQPVALPMPDGVQSIAQIGSGTRYTALLTQDGKLYLTGTGAGSNLGLIQAAGNDRFLLSGIYNRCPHRQHDMRKRTHYFTLQRTGNFRRPGGVKRHTQR